MCVRERESETESEREEEEEGRKESRAIDQNIRKPVRFLTKIFSMNSRCPNSTCSITLKQSAKLLWMNYTLPTTAAQFSLFFKQLPKDNCITEEKFQISVSIS